MQDKGGRGGAALHRGVCLGCEGERAGQGSRRDDLSGHREVRAGTPYANWDYMSAIS